jgi:uncharacterized protein (TIGR02611 family)
MKTLRREPATRSRRSIADVMRRVAIAAAGFLVLTLGVALLVVPIPGTSVVVVPLGLAILAREFKWARKVLVWATASVARMWTGLRRLFGRSSVPPLLPTAAIVAIP